MTQFELCRLVAPVPCEACSGVAFCGRACREAAGYHRFECRHMGLLLGSGMSVLCHLALRAVTQRNLDFFRALQPVLLGPTKDPTTTDTKHLTQEQQKYIKVVKEIMEERR